MGNNHFDNSFGCHPWRVTSRQFRMHRPRWPLFDWDISEPTDSILSVYTCEIIRNHTMTVNERRWLHALTHSALSRFTVSRFTRPRTFRGRWKWRFSRERASRAYSYWFPTPEGLEERVEWDSGTRKRGGVVRRERGKIGWGSVKTGLTSHENRYITRAIWLKKITSRILFISIFF